MKTGKLAVIEEFGQKWSYYLLLKFNSLAEFKTTTTEPTLCTKAPKIGFKIPVIASIIATKLRIKESAKFSLIVDIVF